MKTGKKKLIYTPAKAIVAVALVVIQVYPIFYVFLSSLKTQEDFRKLPSYAFPTSFQLGNYRKVLEVSPIVTYFRNSIIILVFTLAILLVLSSMAGFALAKIKFKSNQFLLNYFMLGLMLPCQVALIPLFTVFSKLNLLNTYAAIILPQVAFALSYSIQLFYSFSKFTPNEIIEAAIIDGCTPLQSYIKVVCPMSTNSLLTVGSMQAVFCWNDFIWANTFIRSSNMKTVTLGINDFVGYMGVTDWGPTFAAIILITIPTFIIYFLTSKYMLAGMTAGAVKG